MAMTIKPSFKNFIFILFFQFYLKESNLIRGKRELKNCIEMKTTKYQKIFIVKRVSKLPKLSDNLQLL